MMAATSISSRAIASWATIPSNKGIEFGDHTSHLICLCSNSWKMLDTEVYAWTIVFSKYRYQTICSPKNVNAGRRVKKLIRISMPNLLLSVARQNLHSYRQNLYRSSPKFLREIFQFQQHASPAPGLDCPTRGAHNDALPKLLIAPVNVHPQAALL